MQNYRYIEGSKIKMKATYLLVAFLALASFASAYDPSSLQDFCVAVPNGIKNAVFVNGKFCKDPKLVVPEDFFKHVDPGNVLNKFGSKATPVTVNELVGLNTLGISLARIDFGPKGLIPPHTHPRATEILTVIQGTLLVGFVTSNQNNTNRLFTKVLNKGDVFVFPIGLMHFQFNIGNSNALAFAALNSQNPGIITISNAVFGSTPPISSEILAKAFQVDNKVINYLQKQFSYDNN
ncbi:germin-like protein subfamily 1 member 15 [Arachis hypogaea]|uniref:germin-like protein subfamily 1 member 15 n=2 Tax=Arachis TaxID=3817 RepID=UPI000DEC302A|nr:germin-like protein subfamily 1 member 15 [Arachis hypogaea]